MLSILITNSILKQIILATQVYFILVFLAIGLNEAKSQESTPAVHFSISIPEPANRIYHVEMNLTRFDQDTLILQMPMWMPGYYQIMNYSDDIRNLSAGDASGHDISLHRINGNTWHINNTGKLPVTISYDILTKRSFVANSYVDSTHAYLVPANSFLYISGHLNVPVTVSIFPHQAWDKIVTGLELVEGSGHEYLAPDFDILYDCPILIGDLEELPAFYIQGIEHRFVGYNIGSFDEQRLMSSLKEAVETAIGIIGDIPYKNYTFIGIGPGRGGIEHQNNTTISFNGNTLTTEQSWVQMLAFITHEYFHHYNVKRIRPFELGPFEYERENRTNQLWVSEGLTVYYEYLIMRRAGLIDERTLFNFLERHITAFENDPGRYFQSLQQSSYHTWEEGPFGIPDTDEDRSISYYDKGPLVGLLLDLSIRKATQNKKSLDDVMRYLYWHFYKTLNRGFTEAEFQQTCEHMAGIPLKEIFEYVCTTKDLDYNQYLQWAGLMVNWHEVTSDNQMRIRKFMLQRLADPDDLQMTILNSWQGIE